MDLLQISEWFHCTLERQCSNFQSRFHSPYSCHPFSYHQQLIILLVFHKLYIYQEAQLLNCFLKIPYLFGCFQHQVLVVACGVYFPDQVMIPGLLTGSTQSQLLLAAFPISLSLKDISLIPYCACFHIPLVLPSIFFYYI